MDEADFSNAGPSHASSSHTSYHVIQNYNYNWNTYFDDRVNNSVDNRMWITTITKTTTEATEATEATETENNLGLDNAADINDRETEAHSILLQELPPPCKPFTGRESYLEEMKQYFEIEVPPSPGAEGRSRERKVFVLYGLGGSGKTQVALKFAELYGSWFSKVFFVDATNAEVANIQLANISRQLKAGGTGREALTCRFDQQANWLLIFDNANDPTLNFRQYFPDGNHGNIIITTRNKRYITYAPYSNIHVTDFSNTSQEAVNLLLKAASLLERPCNVRQSGTTIGEYLDLSCKPRPQPLGSLVSNAQSTNDHNGPTHSMLNISYQRLDDPAKDFLKICAFLHCQKIPKILFQKGIPRLLERKYPSQAYLREWKPIHWISDGEWDEWKFTQTIDQLTSYSLVTVSENFSLYSIQELMHCWVRDNLGLLEDPVLVRETARKLTFFAMEGGKTASDIKYRRLLLPHALKISSPENLGLNDISLLSETCFENSQWALAEKFVKQELQRMREYFGDEDRRTLVKMSNLAYTYLQQGRGSEAEKLNLEALEIHKRIHGEKHLETLESLHNLAWTYCRQKREVEAEKLFLEVLEMQKKVLGEDHPSTLITMCDLASAYHQQERWPDSAQLYKEALKIRKRVLGEKHLDTLMCMHNLAKVYCLQGLWMESEKLYVEGLEIGKESLGKEHPKVLIYMSNLAEVVYNQGKWMEAEKLHTEVLGIRKRVLGEGHPDTLSSMGCLLMVYHTQGRWADGEKLLSSYAKFKGMLGKNRLETANSFAEVSGSD